MLYEKLNEEVRKIQFTGNSTYIISLPKKWIIEKGLKAGDSLFISKQNDSLILTPKGLIKPIEPTEATIIISEQEDPNSIIRKIVALYLVGYNLIRIKTKDKNITSLQKNFIKDLTRKKLVGTEIISEITNEMQLKVLLSYPELSVESALRRMHLITLSMHEDSLKALKDLNKKLAQNVIIMDDEVDRFSIYIVRQLKAAVKNEKVLKDIGLSHMRDCLGYRVIVKFVERIADHAVRIAENVISLKERINESIFQKISEISLFAKSLFDSSMESLYKKDYILADNIIAKVKKMVKTRDEFMKNIFEKADITQILNIQMIIESIFRTAEYASDIAEIVLNLNIDKVVNDYKIMNNFKK
ncbi:MAG: phosphate uptake regulator PhoU [Nitrososphaerota archaeon]